MKIKIAVTKGDGIGPEIMDAVLRIFQAGNVPLDYEVVEWESLILTQAIQPG